MDHLQNSIWVIYLDIQQLWLSFTDKNSFPKLSVHFSFIKPKFKLQEKGISVIQMWEPLENTVYSPGEHWLKIWTQWALWVLSKSKYSVILWFQWKGRFPVSLKLTQHFWQKPSQSWIILKISPKLLHSFTQIKTLHLCCQTLSGKP